MLINGTEVTVFCSCGGSVPQQGKREVSLKINLKNNGQIKIPIGEFERVEDANLFGNLFAEEGDVKIEIQVWDK